MLCSLHLVEFLLTPRRPMFYVTKMKISGISPPADELDCHSKFASSDFCIHLLFRSPTAVCVIWFTTPCELPCVSGCHCRHYACRGPQHSPQYFHVLGTCSVHQRPMMQLTSMIPACGLTPLPRSTAKASLCLPLAFGLSGIFTMAWVSLVHLKSKRVLAECIDGNRDGNDWWLFKDHGEWVTLSISQA